MRAAAAAVLIAACQAGGGSVGVADAGRDAAPAVDAGRDAELPSLDAAQWHDACPETCLGVGCDAPFDPAEGNGVSVSASGGLVLAGGAAEGELRHVFGQQAICEDAWTNLQEVIVTGKLDGVSIEVRGGATVDALQDLPWQSAVSGEALPDLDPHSGCGPALLEVRVVLRAPNREVSPRVDTLGICFGCTLIFC